MTDENKTPDMESILAKVDSQIEKASAKQVEKIDAKLDEVRQILKDAKAGTVSEEDLKAVSKSVEEMRDSLKEAFSQIEKVAKRLDLALEEIRTIGGKKIEKISPDVTKVVQKEKKELMLMEFF